MRMYSSKRRGESGRVATATSHRPVLKATVAAESEPRPRRRRARRTWLIAAGLLVVLIWTAPWMAALPPVRNHLVRLAAADINGQVTLGRLSLGWLSPVELRDLAIADAEGAPVVSVERVTTTKTLGALLLNLSDIGTLRVERPEATITLGEDGSNVEEVFANLLASPSSESASTAAKIEIVGGRMTIEDSLTRKSWLFDPIEATASLSDGSSRNEVEATLTSSGEPRPATITLHAGKGLFDDSSEHGVGVGVGLDHVSLEMFEPIVRRLIPGTIIRGVANGELSVAWLGDDMVTLERVKGGDSDLELTDLQVVSPALGGGPMRLEQLTFHGSAHREGDFARGDLELRCDVGSISSGELSIEIPKTTPRFDSLAGWAAITSTAIGYFEGGVDLAKVSRQLPGLLPVRDGLSIDSGMVAFSFGNEDGSRGARISAGQLAGSYQGRGIKMDEVLSLLVKVSNQDGKPRVETIECDSTFLNVDGRGTLDDFQLSCDYDLDKLTAELGQFFDFDSLRLSGRGVTQLVCKSNANGAFSATSQSQLFDAPRAGMPAGATPSFSVNASADGTLANGRIANLTAATAVAVADVDRLELTLTAPVANPSLNSTWPLHAELRGQLARWKPRLESWLGSLDGWDLDGHVDLKADAQISPISGRVAQATIELRQFHAWGHGLFINEQAARLATNGEWTTSPLRVAIGDTTLEASALGARGQGTLSTKAGAPTEINGELAYNGDLARLAAWLTDPRERPIVRWAGQLQGGAKIAHAGGVTTADWRSVVENLQAQSHMGQPWTEPRIEWSARARHDAASDTLAFAPMTIDSNMLKVEANGQIVKLSTQPHLSLEGQTIYDLDKVTRLLQPYTGASVQLVGKQPRAFRLSGPLTTATSSATALSQWIGQSSLGWDAANAYGFRFGKVDATAELANGQINFTPLDVAVNDGRVRLAPRIDLMAATPMAVLAPGRAAERVKITTEMSNQLIKYVAPMLAGAADVQGSFSIDLEGAAVPLADFSKLDVAGKVFIHSMDVGPGPMIQELAVLLERGGPARLKRESQVTFRVVNGRVYHEALDLEFPEMTIRTRGSVGFDQTLAIDAEMTIPPKWLRNTPLAERFKGKTIHLPIGGTLHQPKLDQRAVDQIAAQIIEEGARVGVEAAEEKVREEIGNQLNRLLRPR